MLANLYDFLPLPLRRQFFTTTRWQIWQILEWTVFYHEIGKNIYVAVFEYLVKL